MIVLFFNHFSVTFWFAWIFSTGHLLLQNLIKTSMFSRNLFRAHCGAFILFFRTLLRQKSINVAPNNHLPSTAPTSCFKLKITFYSNLPPLTLFRFWSHHLWIGFLYIEPSKLHKIRHYFLLTIVPITQGVLLLSLLTDPINNHENTSFRQPLIALILRRVSFHRQPFQAA